MNFIGNFVIFFKDEELSLDFFSKIPENLYISKNKKDNSLRISSFEPQGPKLEYNVSPEPENLVVVTINGQKFFSMGTDHVHAICDTKGKILWQT